MVICLTGSLPVLVFPPLTRTTLVLHTEYSRRPSKAPQFDPAKSKTMDVLTASLQHAGKLISSEVAFHPSSW
jgi:hypothetical protein